MPRQNLDQLRARHLLDRHGRYESKAPSDSADGERFWDGYFKTAKSLPLRIRQNGLALAFGMALMNARREWPKPRSDQDRGENGAEGDEQPAAVPPPFDKRAIGLVLHDIVHFLTAHATWQNWGDAIKTIDDRAPYPALEAFLGQLIDLDRRSYRILQEEVLAYLVWMKTLAAIKAPKEDMPNAQEDGPPPSNASKETVP